MQSVLMSGLRGPDTHHAPYLKAIVRWLRPVTQINADPTTDYMREEVLPTYEDIKKELEFTTVHYFAHLLHAFQIVMYHHPNAEVNAVARAYYLALAEHLHLAPETRFNFRARMGHDSDGL
jgi:hypothetical protein